MSQLLGLSFSLSLWTELVAELPHTNGLSFFCTAPNITGPTKAKGNDFSCFWSQMPLEFRGQALEMATLQTSKKTKQNIGLIQFTNNGTRRTTAIKFVYGHPFLAVIEFLSLCIIFNRFYLTFSLLNNEKNPRFFFPSSKKISAHIERGCGTKWKTFQSIVKCCSMRSCKLHNSDWVKFRHRLLLSSAGPNCKVCS